MTKKIHVHLIDDLDASEASETLRFEVDGRTYEIDLSSRNAQRFRAEIAPYIGHARRVATHSRRRGRSGTGAGRPRGGARPVSRSGVMADPADDDTTIPDYAGSLPFRAALGNDMPEGSPLGQDFGDGEPAPP
jgi:hypothetical protein